MEALLTHYGLIAVLVGAFIECDGTAILSGVLAHIAVFHYPAVLVTVFLGGFLRDVTCYGLGRSSTWTRETDAYRKAAAAVERLVGRFGPLEVLVAPFVYGARTASMIFWGVRQLPIAQFLVYEVIGCAAWATAFSGAGYFLSDKVSDLSGGVKHVQRWLLVAILAGIAALLIVRAVNKWRERRGADVQGVDSR